MNALRTLVVTALLGAWFFPAVGAARPLSGAASTSEAQPRTPATTTISRPDTTAAEAESLAAREKQSPDLQNFKGGGVAIYIGSGTLLVVVIILLILFV